MAQRLLLKTLKKKAFPQCHSEILSDHISHFMLMTSEDEKMAEESQKTSGILRSFFRSIGSFDGSSKPSSRRSSREDGDPGLRSNSLTLT